MADVLSGKADKLDKDLVQVTVKSKRRRANRINLIGEDQEEVTKTQDIADSLAKPRSGGDTLDILSGPPTQFFPLWFSVKQKNESFVGEEMYIRIVIFRSPQQLPFLALRLLKGSVSAQKALTSTFCALFKELRRYQESFRCIVMC